MGRTPTDVQHSTVAPDRLHGRADRDGWVAAAPFRAHLGHLMAVADLTVEMVAAWAGISPRVARLLLDGRRGRPVRRVSRDVAGRLLRITTADACGVDSRTVSAALTRERLVELLADTDGDLVRLARGLDLPESLVATLLDDASCCAQRIALRVAAVHASARPVGPVAPRASPAHAA